jgi:enoyl-CoA hydratase/carnithine racemase/3-hydroxyacyl-CoA dehydrogenase
MSSALRPSTLESLGLGSVHAIFQRGRLPADTAGLVDEVFGPATARGSLVISGANGIVGAGKAMQFASRLQPFGVPVVGLDMPNAPDGIGQKWAGLSSSFGADGASRIMSDIVRLAYDGTHLPPALAGFKPRFLLEAIPEIASLKKAHYLLFRTACPGIEIRSVTSGFPSRELGVGIAHPAFPHEINKVFEIVEEKPSAITKLLWSIGLLPVQVSDHWAFILDVLFCGITLAALRYAATSNMPYWKVDKFVRKHYGANPFRAHDVIGSKGSDFLTWSCLHHLEQEYGSLFTPTADLVERKDTGQAWYPPNHFRPLVDWTLTKADEDAFKTAISGPLIQMTALMLHERRASLPAMNAIGELCAQFRQGVVAMIREMGPEAAVARVQASHAKFPAAARSAWHPEALARVAEPEGQQLYVNAEHDGQVGVISISRESYNRDVDAELNRAIDWLRAAGINRIVVTSDFHLSTQMVGADTSEFFPALDDTSAGQSLAERWTKTARRLHSDFKVSVGVVTGKRCLGGMLELLSHCHFLAAVDGAQLGMPEVTLPVVPGMEGCHWTFRKAQSRDWPKLLSLLLSGRPVRAQDAVGWLADVSGPMETVLATAWGLAAGTSTAVQRRAVNDQALTGVADHLPALSATESAGAEAARQAILECIRASCAAPLSEALSIQARHSAEFMRTAACKKGRIGTEFSRTMTV